MFAVPTVRPALALPGTVVNTLLRALAGWRVLVVEDEYFLADDLASALGRLGATVVGPVPTRADALACLDRGERIDAAVLDINLHGEMVWPLADALLARGLPFVFATGYGQAMVPSAYGRVPRWEKPFDPEDLVRVLPGLLGTWGYGSP